MSRVGKKPIDLPDGTVVSIVENGITIKGAKGELNAIFPESVKLEKVLFAWRKLYSTNCVKLNSKTRVLRRCVVSNRNRGNLRSFGGLSRIVLRNFIHSGILPGYKKAVW